jgi:hypothetical protein
MPSRISRSLALAAGLAIVVAACGGNAATQGPGATGGAPTQAPVTIAPATQPASTDSTPSFAVPSFHGDADLEKMIPSQIGGEAVSTQSMTGTQFMGTANEEFTAVLSTLGKQPSDLSVAFGFNMQVGIVAFQINGVAGSAILDAFKSASADIGTLTDASYGGKSVKKVTPTDTTEDSSYIYTTQDVVFVVTGTTNAPTDALLNEIFSKLP